MGWNRCVFAQNPNEPIFVYLKVRHVQEDQKVHDHQVNQGHQGVLVLPWPQWELQVRLGHQVGLEIKFKAEKEFISSKINK